jgi:hypothetical protein
MYESPLIPQKFPTNQTELIMMQLAIISFTMSILLQIESCFSCPTLLIDNIINQTHQVLINLAYSHLNPLSKPVLHVILCNEVGPHPTLATNLYSLMMSTLFDSESLNVDNSTSRLYWYCRGGTSEFLRLDYYYNRYPLFIDKQSTLAKLTSTLDKPVILISKKSYFTLV